MGMAQPTKVRTRGEMWKHAHPHLEHCKNCDAVYSKSKDWVRGYSDKGTQGQFYPVSRVPENNCPVCGAESKENV